MLAMTPDDFLRAYDGGKYPRSRPATMRAALLVTPDGFRVSEESATDNRYMKVGETPDLERARDQHRRLVEALSRLGVPALVFAGREGLDDAVYPNNVYATIPGRFIVGSMFHGVRRAEAGRADVRELFTGAFGYELWDLSSRDCIAELTGPLVMDRARRIGLCGMTRRVDAAGCAAMHEAFDLELTLRFDLVAGEYHTNLVASILAGRACVLHAASFADPAVVEAIDRLFPGRTLLLSDDEKAHFAANCLAVTEEDVLFSSTSMRALRRESVERLERWGFRCHAVDVDELEKGGGSLRCLIAEIL